MNRPLKYCLLAAGLLAAGGLRATWEQPMTREFRAAGLLSSPVGIDTRDRIGQTSSAVALGGLRTLVATFLNIRSFTYFSEKRWGDVADTYDLIVDLAPNTIQYWDMGSWHMAYNAAGDYRTNSDLPAARRREAWQEWIKRGEAFLRRGIRNNPDDWQLPAALGRICSAPDKLREYPEAVEAFRASADTGKALPYVRRLQLYSLARCSGREAEALEMARGMYASPRNRTTTMVAILFALEQKVSPSTNPTARAIELFEGDKAAYDGLSLYWLRENERFPVDGVASALKGLETKFAIPEAKSIFRKIGRRNEGPEDWFKSDTELFKEELSDRLGIPSRKK
ncbi:hypothetical protein KBB96_17240 [Luteolibacter ambystomatis]|uniref:DUF4034 domain-containing protein n=1 Tax=Luteolibacter ambystomatis TaxID=2824561 RepID=A0A975IZX1_9BACT|nr:hypothetical protein [Luteolibacter ambystomatis]QUE50595.1 hypothetical protein KBB96_17240 [Luteolibacter ambystomatis]